LGIYFSKGLRLKFGASSGGKGSTIIFGIGVAFAIILAIVGLLGFLEKA